MDNYASAHTITNDARAGPLEGLTPQERLERYATLFVFTTEDDIDTDRLAEQWNVDQRGVASMIRYAKNNEKLNADMRSLYEDTDFPGWWYSPARNENGTPPSSTEIDATPPSKTDVGAENAGNGELRAPDPTVDPSIVRGSQRPPLPLRSDPLRSAAPISVRIRPHSRRTRSTC